ncbi:MAG: late competence development ComFB family protein [Anaerolineae bacterium]|nr:late competence development ComFB family protein [Gloeobacterales cyanobacterium ES-bin-313]
MNPWEAKTKKLQMWQDPKMKRSKRRFNVMESLVIKEIEAQYSRLSEQVHTKIDLTDVEAWVLNRLPPRYVTSKRWAKSVEDQILQEQGGLLVGTVRKGLFAVYNNAQPSDTPLFPEISTTEGSWNWESTL